MVLIIYGLMKLSSPLFAERRASFQRGICISCLMTRKLFLTFPSFPPRALLVAENRQSASVCALADCRMIWLKCSHLPCALITAGKINPDYKTSRCQMPGRPIIPDSNKLQIPTIFHLIGFSFNTLSGWVEPPVLSWTGEFTPNQQADYNCSTLGGWGRISGSSPYCPNPIQTTDTW